MTWPRQWPEIWPATPPAAAPSGSFKGAWARRQNGLIGANMYPKNAASPERIAVGAVVQISDGAVQTSGVSVKVMPQGAAASAGGGTIAYEEGIVHYLPTQAETNYASFMLLAYKTGCIPACVTVVTTASGVAGYAGLDWSVVRAPTTTLNLSGTTISTSQAVASVSGAVGSVAGLIASNLDATISSRMATYTQPAGFLAATFPSTVASTTNITSASGVTLQPTTGLGNQTANITGNLSGSVGSVTGAVGSVTGAVGSVIAAVSANVTQISGSTAAADNLEAHALRAVSVTFAAGGSTTTAVLDLVDGAAASAVDDVYNGRMLIFSAPSNLKDQATSITDYVGATKTATIVAVTNAPIATAAAVMV